MANKATASAPKQTQEKKDLAPFKYIGDDGGRWVFERRSDGLCITIDKPKVELNGKSGRMGVTLTAHGYHVHDEAVKLCRK